MSASPDDVRRAIAEELALQKYRYEEPWYASLIEWLERAFTRFVEWLIAVSEIFGGPVVTGIILSAVLVSGVALIVYNLGRRRARMVEERLRREQQAVRGLDPRELERQAAAAAAAGNHDEAFRYQFQALLIRFDEDGLIDLKPGTTSGSVDGTLQSAEFHSVAVRFDEVAYGGESATAADRDSVLELYGNLLVRQ